MPPRYAYWTILVNGGPTAFRAAEPDELLPTLKRLQVKQPDAVMKWFEKGRLWESRDEAREKLSAGYTVGADGALVPPADGERPRTKSWRPGGEHRDPREKYQLAKKAKWQRFKQQVRARRGHGPKAESEDAFAPFEGDEPRPRPEGADETNERFTVEPEMAGTDDAAFDEAFERAKFDDGPDEGDSAPAAELDWRGRPKAPSGDRPRTPQRKSTDRGGDRPRGAKPAWRDRAPKSFDRGADRPRGPKPAWRDKPQGEWRGKPAGSRPAWKPRPEGDRPPRPFDRDGGDRPRGPKPAWRDKPQGEWRGKPGGSRPGWKPRPEGDRPPRPFDRDGGDRPRGPKPEWRDRGPKSFDRGGDRPRGPKPEWRDRAPKPFDRDGGDRPRGPKPEWRDRGPKPFDRGGDRPKGGPRGKGPGGFKPGGRGRSGPPKRKP